MITLEALALRQGSLELKVDLDLAKGQRLAVIGASGAGKSSLLNLIAGFQVPDAGRVVIDGRNVTAMPVAQRPVSILFQDGNLFPHLSVSDNVALGIEPSLKLHWEDQARVAEALAQVGMDGMDGRRPGSLSGGQVARVALARMLLRDQPVALMDEPFAALDPGLRHEMAALVADLCEAQGITLVIVAHELRGLERLATDLCLMADGQIAVMGGAAELLSNPPAELRPWL